MQNKQTISARYMHIAQKNIPILCDYMTSQTCIKTKIVWQVKYNIRCYYYICEMLHVDNNKRRLYLIRDFQPLLLTCQTMIIKKKILFLLQLIFILYNMA